MQNRIDATLSVADRDKMLDLIFIFKQRKNKTESRKDAINLSTYQAIDANNLR